MPILVTKHIERRIELRLFSFFSGFMHEHSQDVNIWCHCVPHPPIRRVDVSTNAKNYILFVGILFGNNLSLKRVGNDRNCKSDTIIETYTKRNQECIPEHVFCQVIFKWSAYMRSGLILTRLRYIYSQLLNSVQTGTNIRFISVMELHAPANI